jgi:hypothetical protein
VGLERHPLNLVSTIEELLERKSSGSGLESREYSRRDPSRRPRGALYPLKLALTSPTGGGGSVGIVRSRTQATELFYYLHQQNVACCTGFDIIRTFCDTLKDADRHEFSKKNIYTRIYLYKRAD